MIKVSVFYPSSAGTTRIRPPHLASRHLPHAAEIMAYIPNFTSTQPVSLTGNIRQTGLKMEVGLPPIRGGPTKQVPGLLSYGAPDFPLTPGREPFTLVM